MFRRSEEQLAKRFICPGCGERATAKDGFFCKKCGAFVHKECAANNEPYGAFPGVYCCPVCAQGLVTYDK